MKKHADAASQSITVVRAFAAPVEDVYQAFTTPALMQQWLAPWPMKVREVSADPRVGGSYRFVVEGPFGICNTTYGEYQELIPNRRIVKTWLALGSGRDATPYPTLLTVDFRATSPTTTEVTLKQEKLLTAIDRAGNLGGWRRCFKKLDRVLGAE